LKLASGRLACDVWRLSVRLEDSVMKRFGLVLLLGALLAAGGPAFAACRNAAGQAVRCPAQPVAKANAQAVKPAPKTCAIAGKHRPRGLQMVSAGPERIRPRLPELFCLAGEGGGEAVPMKAPAGVKADRS
jgi:hypothetical protein